MICTVCHKDYPTFKYGKMRNGKQKNSCERCCLKRKKNKTIEDKQYVNNIKLHKELRKKFEPQRRREYAREYKKNYIRPLSKICPTFGWQRRSCSHCKRPHEFPIRENTIRNKKILLQQLIGAN